MSTGIKDKAQHTFTAYKNPDGFILTIDGNVTLETERGDIRKFRKLDALCSLIKDLGVDKFTVSLHPRVT